MKKELNNQKGFTLIEIICAIALLGLIAVPTYNVVVGSSLGQSKSKLQQSANNDAQAIMEDLIADSNIAVGTTDYTYDDFLASVTIEKSTDLENDLNNGSNTLTVNKAGQPTPDPNVPDDEFVNTEPEEFNARLEVFDYDDTDLDMMARTACFLLFEDDNVWSNYKASLNFDGNDYLNESSFYALGKARSYKPLEKYDANTVIQKVGLKSTDEYYRMRACFDGLSEAQVKNLLTGSTNGFNGILPQYTQIARKFANCFSGYGGVNYNEVKAILKNSDNFIQTLVDAFNDTRRTVPVNSLNVPNFDSFKYQIGYLYPELRMSMALTPDITSINGHMLRIKFFDNNDNLLDIFEANERRLGSINSEVQNNVRYGLGEEPYTNDKYSYSFSFWIYENRLYFYNFGKSYDLSYNNVLGAKLTDITSTYHQSWGDQVSTISNVYQDSTVYVTGHLSLSNVDFTTIFSINNDYANPEKNKNMDERYTPNLNLAQHLYSGADKLKAVLVESPADVLTINQSISGKSATPSSGSQDTSYTITYNWGDENDNVYKITVSMYKKSDTAKKKPLATLISFKNVSKGATVTTVKSTSSGSSELPILADLPSSSEADIKYTFTADSPASSNMSFTSGAAFSMDLGDITSSAQLPAGSINPLVMVFDGDGKGHTFNIKLIGSESNQDNVFVIYNNSGATINVSGSGTSWLKYNGVVVVDADKKITVLK